jgi:hypothetical protein
MDITTTKLLGIRLLLPALMMLLAAALYETATAQTVVRILVCSTNQARSDMAAAAIDPNDVVNAEFTRLDVAYRQNSQINVQFVLAGYYEWNYNESTDRSDCPGDYCGYNAYSIDMGALRNDAGVNQRRNECAADLVVLLVQQPGTSVAGLANTPGERNLQRWGTVYYNSFARVTPHEVGHNCGCQENSGYCDPINHFRTIMTYAGAGCAYNESIEYFCADTASGIRYNGWPIGDVYHNNRQVIINYLPATSAYSSPQDSVVFSNRTTANNEYYDNMANNQITTGANTIIGNGGETVFRCNGKVSIGNGFTSQNGARLTIRAGAGSLSKKRIEPNGDDAPKFALENAKRPIDLTFDATSKGDKLNLRFALLEAGTIYYSIFDISGRTIYRSDFYTFLPGPHVVATKLALLPQTVVVKLTSSGKTYTKRIALH